MCATPRSGSTLLCALLAGTAVAGRPEEYFECLWRSGAPRQPREYFAGVDDDGLLALLAPTDPGDPDRSDPFPSALERGTTANGVFGAKLMWTHLLDLADRLERPADPALLAERLPELRYVHGPGGRPLRPLGRALPRRARRRVTDRTRNRCHRRPGRASSD